MDDHEDPDADGGTGASPVASTTGVVAVRAAGDDLDQAKSLFTASYQADDYRVDTTGQPFTWAHTALGDGDMTLRTSRFLAGMRGTAHPDGEYIVGWLRRGHGTVGRGADSLDVGVHEPWGFPSAERYPFELVDVEMSSVQLRRGFLDQLAAEHGLAGPDAGRAHLRLDHRTRPGPAALARWQGVVAQVARTLHDPGTLSRPLLRLELARTAGLALLTAFAGPDPDPTTGRIEHRAVRVAVEYLHANAHRPIGTADAALACGLSVRGLQQAFRRVLGTTPGECLRDVRLERVHRVLAAAAPGQGVRVGDVARSWGFTHLGRFAGSYQQRYGETPARTLRTPPGTD